MTTHNGLSAFLSSINNISFYQRHIPGFRPNGKDEVSCRCPFHDDHHNSFSVNIETGLWHCFSGCGSGNPIQIVQKLYDLPFRAATERIAHDEGIDSPFQRQNGNQHKKRRKSYLTSNQITALHNDLVKNAPILKQFQEKYGLTLETIKKYQLGYKQGKYVIPIEVSPGKWHYKQHKGYQTRGAKAVIYPPDIIKDSLPYIIVTEGEFKALLLNQSGFPAVSNTSGAGTWKQQWNSLFKGLIVILAYDNDEAGKKGAKKVASNLKGMAQSVKRIQWPSYMNSKDRKDVTDFFIVLGKTKSDFQALIDNAIEVGYDIKEVDGLKFVEPDDYQVDEEGIKHLSLFKDNTIEKVISPAPVVITARAIDIDLGNEEIEIAFRRDWKWKRLWVSRRTLCDSRKVIELSDQGVPVNSSNARQLVDYFCASETINIPVIKRTYVTKGLGWKEINDKKIFLITKNNSEATTRAIDFTPEPGFERFVKALNPLGSFDKWKEAIKLAILFPFSNFAFYASFAAPLLHILKAPNFIIDFWGPTSVGKTSVLELAASVWGNPHKESGGLVFSWDSTRVFLERMANFFCDVPIFPDDSQTTDDKTLTKILYMVANGVGRGRGSTVGIRQTASWRTVCFSTGEKPLTECTTFAGAKARTIGFYGPPFGSMKVNVINTIKNQLRENYGHAGPMFVRELAKRVNNQEWVKQLQRDYRQKQRVFSSMATIEIGDRVSHYFAVVDVAARLVNEILDIRHEQATDMITQVFLDYVNESIQDTDMATRAIKHVLSWASGNERYFKNPDLESYGVWAEGEHIAIYPHKLTEVLRKEGFSEKSVLKEWNNRKWIKTTESNYTYPIRVKEGMDIKRRRMIVIQWLILDKFLS
jgi:putative DNA primase/helicase